MTELHRLPTALAALFPGHEFVGVQDRPTRPFAGFTSHRLGPANPQPELPTVLDKLAARAASMVDPDTAAATELAVVVDDLELANRDQPARVVEHVRATFQRHVAQFEDADRRERLAAAIRNRVSFHLVAPMIESWFFAAPSALTILGLRGDTAFHIRPGDPEQFESTDRSDIAANASLCTEWCKRRRRPADGPRWIAAGEDCVYHPKGYVQWLLSDPAHTTCTSYRAGWMGARALAAVDWVTLLGHPDAMPFARALVADITAALAQAPAVERWEGELAPATAVGLSPGPTTLRNI